MSNLTTLPKGDSAWLLRKSIQRVMQQISVLETNIGSSTTGNSSDTQVIFNDNGVLRGDPDLTFNTALNKLVATALESTTSLVVGTSATITGNSTIGGSLGVTGALTSYTGQVPSAIRAAASDYAAVTFDGATTSTRITSTLTGQNIGTGDFSLWSRFRVPALAAFASNPGVISLGQSASDGTGNNSFRIILLSGGSLSIRSNDGSGVSTNSDVSGFSAAYSGQVVDIVVTRTGSTVKLYINGTDTAITGTLNGSNSITSTYCHVGIGAAGSAIFSGRIYRSVVFNRALSASDVTELITTGVNPADQWGTQTQIVNTTTLNGGFETAGAGGADVFANWVEYTTGTATLTRDTTDYSPDLGSTASAKATGTDGTAVWSLYNSTAGSLVANKRYRLSAAHKRSSSASVSWKTSSTNITIVTFSLTTSWANYSAEFVMPSNETIKVDGGGATTLWTDNVIYERIGAIVDLDFTVGGGSTAYDRSTNGLDGTLFGGVSWTMPRDGQYINGPSTITGDLTARNWFVTGGSLPGVGNGNPFAYRIGGGGLGIGAATETGTTAPIVFYAGQGGVEQYRIAPLGVNTWSDGAGGTRMTLNATGLGVGKTPSGYRLDVAGFGNFEGLRVAAANATKMDLVNTTSGLTYSLFSANTAANGFNGFAIFNGTDYDLRIVSGNVGIGVAIPSSKFHVDAGSSSEYFRGAGNSGAARALVISASTTTNAGDTHTLNASSVSGVLAFSTNAIERMRLDASGNLILLSSNTPATLTTNGQLTVNATSNTNLRFSYRGSDGVTRTANLTLA